MKQILVLASGPVLMAGLFWMWAGSLSPELIRDLPEDAATALPDDDPTLIAAKPVEFNAEVLEAMDRGLRELVLPLWDGESLTLLIEEPLATHTGGKTFAGQVKQQPDSSAVLVWEDGVWAGSVDLPDGRFFALLHTGGGRYRLEQVDLTEANECHTDEQAPPGEWSSENREARMARDGTSRTRAPGMTQSSALRRVTQTGTVVQTQSQRYQRLNLRTVRPRVRVSHPRAPGMTTTQNNGATNPSSNQGQQGQQSGQQSGNQNQGGGSSNQHTSNSRGGTPSGVTGNAGTGNLPPFGGSSAGQGPTGVSGGGGSTIDLLMVYGDGVAQRYGGASGVKAACQLAVQLANNAFTRSRANVRLRLVHVSAVNYRAGANLETDLRNLTSRDRGLVQHVRYLRNTHKADLVSMVVGRGGGGVGWLLNRASGSPKHGISIIGLASLRGYTLAHEVGHNLGCQHARDDQFTEGGSTSGNGYGFRFHASNSSGVAAQFRTVMAYAPGRRIAHFSNPAVRYQGTPTGANNANNVRQLNRSLGVVSAYR